ncbi:MAG: hypothetical protein HRU12_12025 [Phaeodactylibacter sp.]|nr:hypothetical protein [Phaeodactylibacter sp.]
MDKNASTIWFRVLQWSAASVLFARGWQHLYWDAPFRTLLWDQAWMEGIIQTVLGMDWQSYVTHPKTDLWIQDLVFGTGVFYVIAGIVAATILRWGRPGRIILWASSLGLMILAALYCKEKFYFLGQFFEYALQFTAPAILAWVAVDPEKRLNKKLLFVLKVAIAFTFTCHGLYALGYYPRPGYFVFMVMSITGVDEVGAARFLEVAAILDFVLSVLIFLPGKVARIALAYAVFWGFSTTIARPWAYAYVTTWDTLLLQWAHEAIMRFPHFLGPITALGLSGSFARLPELGSQLKLVLKR